MISVISSEHVFIRNQEYLVPMLKNDQDLQGNVRGQRWLLGTCCPLGSLGTVPCGPCGESPPRIPRSYPISFWETCQCQCPLVQSAFTPYFDKHACGTLTKCPCRFGSHIRSTIELLIIIIIIFIDSVSYKTQLQEGKKLLII